MTGPSRAFPKFESYPAIEATSPLPLAGEVGIARAIRVMALSASRVRGCAPSPRPSVPQAREREKGSRLSIAMQELIGFMESIV
jgi:hypothetical protein